MGRSVRVSALQSLRLLQNHKLGVSHDKFAGIRELDPSVLYPYVAGPNKYDVFDRTPGCAENPTYRNAPQAQQPMRKERTVVAVVSMMLLGSVHH